MHMRMNTRSERIPCCLDEPILKDECDGTIKDADRQCQERDGGGDDFKIEKSYNGSGLSEHEPKFDA